MNVLMEVQKNVCFIRMFLNICNMIKTSYCCISKDIILSSMSSSKFFSLLQRKTTQVNLQKD